MNLSLATCPAQKKPHPSILLSLRPTIYRECPSPKSIGVDLIINERLAAQPANFTSNFMNALLQNFGPIGAPLIWLALTMSLFYGTCWATTLLPADHSFRIVARSITGAIAFSPTLALLGYIALPLPASFVITVCLADNGSLAALRPPNIILSAVALLVTFAVFFAKLSRAPKPNHASSNHSA